MSESTATRAYTDRLLTLQTVWWKRLIPVQLPYRLHLRSLKPGFLLDVGCGIGRNLLHVNGHGIGVDHNPESVSVCKSLGFTAFTAEDFHASQSPEKGRFDSILLSHVLEHMPLKQGAGVLTEYLPYLKKNGRVILVCPQEKGYSTDQTHVEYLDQSKLSQLLKECGLQVEKAYSFPFPTFAGKFFAHNEHVVIGRKV